MGKVNYSKKADSLTLSEFIELVEGSVRKTPPVKNHDQLVSLLPKMKSILETKGDVEFKMADLMKLIR